MIEATGGTVHWLTARGGVRLRAAHWPRGPRGTVLLLNGRTEYIEKYREPVAELQTRGFAVWTLDWRGQGGSARLLPDTLPNHVDRFGDYLDDLGLLLDRHVLPGLAGRKLVLLAHSMGGHLGAHMLVRRGGMFDRAILCAPMIDVPRFGRLPRPVMRMLVGLACLRPGAAGRFAPGTRRFPDLDRPLHASPITSCPDRHEALIALMRARPDLTVGGATWGWVRAAMASIAALRRPAVIGRIGLPVLVALAGADRLVDNPATRRFTGLLPQGELLEFPEARHELLREHDRFRLPLWAAIDRFLAPV